MGGALNWPKMQLTLSVTVPNDCVRSAAGGSGADYIVRVWLQWCGAALVGLVVSWTQGGSSETVTADWLRLNRLDPHAASSVRSKMLSVDCALAHDTAQDLRPLWKSRFLRGPFFAAVVEVRAPEGMASKRGDAPYRSGECRDWRKVKTEAWPEANRDGGGYSNDQCDAARKREPMITACPAASTSMRERGDRRAHGGLDLSMLLLRVERCC